MLIHFLPPRRSYELLDEDEFVGSGDLHRARAELRVRMLVGDDRDLAAMRLRPDRDPAQLADDRRVARVRRMHRHRAVAAHGSGAGGGAGDVVARTAPGAVAVGGPLYVLVGLAAGPRVFAPPPVGRHLTVASDS